MYKELIVDIEDMAKMAEEDKEAFTLNRRKGFGASDSSILLGVNHWTTREQLIAQKNTDYITEDELEIGNKPQVRMGADLEPLILQKFMDWSHINVAKPSAQYRVKEFPFLTVNYDGLIAETEVPVECKCISQFARKYWDFSKAINSPGEYRQLMRWDGASLTESIIEQAKQCGIPPYYYTQVQQQLIGVKANYAYLVALDVKEWQIHVFYIPEDGEVQTAIIMTAAAASELCEQIPNHLIVN